MFWLNIFFAVFLCIINCPRVASHGYVHNVNVNNQDYQGWLPFVDNYLTPPPNRVVRKILDDGYVTGDSSDLPCNRHGNDGAGIVADVAAGSQIAFYWSYWPADHQGPVSTYMASCNGDCTTFSASDGRWFKLDATGYDPSTRMWGADQLMKNNNTWTSTIPAELAPGQYLVRNEIVALHSSEPQFYPSCSQVNVKGSGTSQPSQNDLVSIPGLYSNAVWPKSIYSDFGTFSIPGPAPVTFGASGTSEPITTPAHPTMTSGVGDSTPTSSASNSGNNPTISGQCLLSRRRMNRRTLK